MIIDKALLDDLTSKAKSSPRLRMNLDMRNSDWDQSQRMLNAIEPGTELPIHRHPKTSESCFILRGRAEQLLFDDNGNVTDRFILEPGSQRVGLNIKAGQWHKIVSLEPGTVIFEAKDGPYEPVSPEDIVIL